jgi:Flp pilus assembly pilin Flp
METKMRFVTHLQILIHRLKSDKAGAVATEYAFLIAFIAIVAAAGMGLLGNNLSSFFDDIGQALNNAGDAIPTLPS